MIVPTYQIVELWSKHKIQNLDLKADLTPENTLSDPVYLTNFTKETYENLSSGHSEIINFVYHPELRALLLKHFQDYYQPAYNERISMLRIFLQQFEMANQFSRGKKMIFKKRYIKSLETVMDTDGQKILVEFNQEILQKDLDFVKLKYNDDFSLKYTTSEKGILLIYDQKGYAHNPQLTKLQFQVRKIFHDIRYKRVISADIGQGFANYFKTFEGNNPKAVVLCGRTEKNEYLSKQIRVFDPLVKLLWVEVDDLNRTADDIFDKILPKLGSDYSYETLIYDPDDATKENLPQNDAKDLKEQINLLSREFSIKEYIDIENAIIDKMRKYTMKNQFTHLYNTIEALKISKDVIFNKLLEGYFD